jgi:hypothetical protein
MDRFMSRQNIEHYRKLRETPNAAERRQLLKLLAEEKAKFNLELQNVDLAQVSRTADYRPEQYGREGRVHSPCDPRPEIQKYDLSNP